MAQTKGPTSKDRAGVYLKAAMEALHSAGGSLLLKEIKEEVKKRVDLYPEDLQVYEKSGYVRWESVLHFYSIDMVKAGYILKQGGRWYLTPEGEQVRALSSREIIDRANKAYREWSSTRTREVESNGVVETANVTDASLENVERSLLFERAASDARAEIEEHVRRIDPYEFQKLVAALLRAMGYATPFVAPLGPDGGTDVLAYPDPIGAQTPHIRVQVKHRQSSKSTREEIAALRGIIRQDREIGLFVSSGGFTSEAIREARHGAVHIELMDLDNLLNHWLRHYDKIAEEDRSFLRLRPVYFLAIE